MKGNSNNLFFSFEHYGQKMTVDECEYNVTLWDTAGQEDYERLRPLTYPNVSTIFYYCCFKVIE